MITGWKTLVVCCGVVICPTGDALLLMRAGLNAVIPDDDWDLAEDILRALTDGDAHVLLKLHFARNVSAMGLGDRAPHLQCDCPSRLAGVTRRRRENTGELIWYEDRTRLDDL